MKRIVNVGKWLGICLLAAVSVTACVDKAPDYSGKYELLMGQNCDMVGIESAFVELALAGEGQDRRYVVRFPSAAQVGLPALSAPGAFNDSNELTVFFTQSSEGFMGTAGNKTLALTLEPHASKAGHLWITRWEGEALTNGRVSAQENVLAVMLEKYNTGIKGTGLDLAQSMDLTNTALCLGNMDRISPEERTAWRDGLEADVTALMDVETSKLNSLSFKAFWGLWEGCKTTPATPTCLAHGELFDTRVAAEIRDAKTRLRAMPEPELMRVGNECDQRPRLPQCEVYRTIMQERTVAEGEALKKKLAAMPYGAFKAKRQDYCADIWSSPCKLYRSLEAEKHTAEVNRMLTKHSGQELFDLEWGACNSQSPTYRKDHDLCKFLREVAQSKRDQKVAYFSGNSEKLRDVHNACFDEYTALRGARKSKEANALKKTFRCMTALDGARAVGHRGQFTSVMK